MVGLSASQLPPATLSAGDTIEYFSRAFELFDSRGHRTTIVLRVAPDDDPDFPVTVDTGEPFPMDMWCRLVSDRAGNKYKPSYASWRTLRTYSLRPGTFDAPTRSRTLRTALQDAVNDAFESTHRQLRLESEGLANTHAGESNDDQAAVESDISTSSAASMQNQVPPSGCIRDSNTDEGRTCEETAIGSPITGDDAENCIIPAESIVLLSSTSTLPTKAIESGATSAELSDQAHTPEASTDETAGGCNAADVEPQFVPASSTVIPDQTLSGNDPSRAVACAEGRPCEGIGVEQAKTQLPVPTAPAAFKTATDQDILDANEYLKTIPTRYMREKIRHQAKKRANAWSQPRSRKRHHQARCGVTRSGTQLYHVKSLKARKVQALLELPGVLDRLHRLHQYRPAYVEPVVEPVVDADREAEGLPWPAECKQIVSCLNPKGVLFKDIGEFDKCGCIGDCFLDTCDNVASAVYCTPACCGLNAVCSNAPVDRKTLRLFDTGRVGLGLMTTTDLEVGDIVGEYAGVLLELDGLREGQPIQAVKRNSGYTMLYNTKSVKNWFVYVEALKFGAMTRFISHACDPNAAFVELQNRSTVKVFVRMIRSVKSGAQITVHYGDETWFKCACDKCWKDDNHEQTQ